MRLKSDNLLLNYRLEAARPTENYGAFPQNIHGGWEFPTCQLRGHFLGYWLSAAAMHYHETGDMELKAKADAIVAELYACQQAYWEGGLSHGLDDGYPRRGLVTYFLPMRAGGRKGWASEIEDLFCCDGTAV